MICRCARQRKTVTGLKTVSIQQSSHRIFNRSHRLGRAAGFFLAPRFITRLCCQCALQEAQFCQQRSVSIDHMSVKSLGLLNGSSQGAETINFRSFPSQYGSYTIRPPRIISTKLRYPSVNFVKNPGKWIAAENAVDKRPSLAAGSPKKLHRSISVTDIYDYRSQLLTKAKPSPILSFRSQCTSDRRRRYGITEKTIYKILP